MATKWLRSRRQKARGGYGACPGDGQRLGPTPPSKEQASRYRNAEWAVGIDRTDAAEQWLREHDPHYRGRRR